MKVTILIPDEAYETLGGSQQTVQSQITTRLKLLPDMVHPEDRLLILTADARRELEEALGQPLETAADLIKAVKMLAVIKIGLVERPLTTGEAARIAQYAQSMGLSEAVAVRELIDPIFEELFNRV